MAHFIMQSKVIREYRISAEDETEALLVWAYMDEEDLDKAFLGEYDSSDAPSLIVATERRQ